MIGRTELGERAAAWTLRPEVVEKDYVIGWLLWGIGSDPLLARTWAFKGGTCLKKCFMETYRFSEDLDFTVLPGGQSDPGVLVARFESLLDRVGTESGLDLTSRPPRFDWRPDRRSIKGRLYYRGPRGAPQAARVLVDVTVAEAVVRPTVLRPIRHDYSDELPPPGTVRCYSFEEVFAEKIRAMGERCRPRDLYDIVNLYRRDDLRGEPDLVRTVLDEKCASKGVPVPDAGTFDDEDRRAELASEWHNMLAHQLPALPSLEGFWTELVALFEWLAGRSPVVLPQARGVSGTPWTPPRLGAAGGSLSRLGPVRFAAANRLCVEILYGDRWRTIEPYSLRQSSEGNVSLFGHEISAGHIKQYRVDRIQRVRVANRPFTPRWRVELTEEGPLRAPPTARREARATRNRRPSRAHPGPTYVVECPYCRRRFSRRRLNLSIRPHKDRAGFDCAGRHGRLVEHR